MKRKLFSASTGHGTGVLQEASLRRRLAFGRHFRRLGVTVREKDAAPRDERRERRTRMGTQVAPKMLPPAVDAMSAASVLLLGGLAYGLTRGKARPKTKDESGGSR